MNVVSDCGAYLYTASQEWRNRFRSTAFHNVVQADDEELNRFVGDDALWQLRYDAHPADVDFQEGAGYFCGGHDGYARLAPAVMPVRELMVDPRRPRVTLRDRIGGAGPHRLTWRFHFDPAVTAELVGHDCRLRAGDGEVWMLAAEDDRRGRRLERGWISPSYGVRHQTSVLVVEDTRLPSTLSCLFAESRLPADARRQMIEQLDARAKRVH